VIEVIKQQPEEKKTWAKLNGSTCKKEENERNGENANGLSSESALA